MFAQFRSQYPQGSIQTEMLPKIDGLHAFRAIVSQGDAVMGTATAIDSDLEIAEDRAIKRALAIAGIAFDHNFDSNYSGRSPMLTQVSRESTTVNSLPSANFNAIGAASLSSTHSNRTHTTHNIESEPALEYVPDQRDQYADRYADEYIPEKINDFKPSESDLISPIPPKPITPQIAQEPMDLSNAISNIDVEMARLGWTKAQGRDYLVRTFDKKSRQQLTNDELLRFLSHLKSLATPPKPSASDDFF
ncbi:MAG: hypothetical protein DCE90_17210 [Pseudanabaena sp.]|nr:MAG: hypothetical protein DCE90_17210 [Pseudanabaena sp.]